MISKYKVIIAETLDKIKLYNNLIKSKNDKKIIHMLTPIHGNMGDQAIVYATNKFLSKEFSEYKIIEIYKKDIYKYAKIIKKNLNKDDLIVLIGGGNMGNLWIDEEKDRRFVIKTFKENKIISMPQTISFTNDDEGKKELYITKKIYNDHKNLTLIAREKKSFEIMKKEFVNANIILNPDMVLSLFNDYPILKNDRKGIMTCLRNDKEGVLGEKKEILIDKLKKNYSNIINYDTVVDKVILKEEREYEINEMLNKFKKCKVVITDRLHGMVFAAITRTPCIVTKSLDHKVTGTYEWIKDLNYIKLVDNLEFDNIRVLIDELIQLKESNEIVFKNDIFNQLKTKLYT